MTTSLKLLVILNSISFKENEIETLNKREEYMNNFLQIQYLNKFLLLYM